MITPQHVAIIMDGNGRWASERGRPRTYGHLQGARAARKIIRSASQKGVKYLTLFTFSTENWRRPETEVNFLMQLLSHKIKREQASLLSNNIRFRAIGDLSKLPQDAYRAVNDTISQTRENSGLQLTFALNYGGRQEIVQTVRSLVEKVKSEEISTEKITEALFEECLPSKFLPNPDLIIRTSGELRLSNFFLWQSAYSELYIVDKYWPDFNETDFDLALQDYAKRKRKYGGLDINAPSSESQPVNI